MLLHLNKDVAWQHYESGYPKAKEFFLIWQQKQEQKDQRRPVLCKSHAEFLYDYYIGIAAENTEVKVNSLEFLGNKAGILGYSIAEMKALSNHMWIESAENTTK